MSWRDELRPAKFRGAEFKVETIEHVTGRRAVIHVYPGKNEAYAEDLGRVPRAFNIEAFFIGPDYVAAKDKFLDAIETEGVGELVLPFYGTVRVQPGEGRFIERRQEGGYAVVSVPFTESAVTPSQPSAALDTLTAARNSAAALQAAAETDFFSTYNPGTVLDSVETATRDFAAALNKARLRSQATVQAAASLNRFAVNMANDAAGLARSPANLVAAIKGSLALIPTLLGILDVFGFNKGTRPPETTATRRLEASNFDALTAFVQRCAAASAVTAAVDIAFVSYQDAVDTQGRLADIFDDLSDSASDTVYGALVQARADLVNAVPGPGGDLPDLLTYIPPTELPTLAIAQSLYGTTDLEGDITTRNDLPNPMFAPARVPLEVLSHD